MISGSINENTKSLPKAIKKAVQYLKETDFSILEDGKYPIEGEDIFAFVVSYKTEDKPKKMAEAHKRYIDIQFIISGKETIFVGKKDAGNEVIEEYSDEKDVILYGSVVSEREFVLKKGDYIVLYPGDIHRPGCNFEGQNNVRKAVVKVAVDLISD